MKKLLLIDKNTEENLTFEEVLEKYENLIKSLIKSYVINYGYEDMFQVASIGLWKAYKNYDIEKYRVAFGYYASLVIRNELKINYRNSKKNINNALSLNDCVSTEDGNTEYIDLLENGLDLENEVICKESFRQVLQSLKEKERVFLILSLNGVEQNEIARRYNMLQPSVSRIIRGAKSKLVSCLG